MTLRRRLKQLEAAIPTAQPADDGAIAEWDALVIDCADRIWQTIPPEYQAIIEADLRALAADQAHKLSGLSLAFRARVRELMKGSILPQAMPGPVCQAYLDFPEKWESHDCEDCGYRTFHIFETCPLCGGKVGWYAYYLKTGFCSTIEQVYAGNFPRYKRLSEATGRW